jgi:hypothetical protein
MIAGGFTVLWLWWRWSWHNIEKKTSKTWPNGGATVLWVRTGDRIHVVGKIIDLDLRSHIPFWIQCGQYKIVCGTILQNDRMFFLLRWHDDAGLDTESDKTWDIVIKEGHDIEFTVQSTKNFTVSLNP